MNILLLYPKSSETVLNFHEVVKITGRKSSYPPLGLLTVAALLPEEWNKKVVDLNVKTLKEEDVHWADYVFISSVFSGERIHELIAFCKNLSAKIVAGGPVFTNEYQSFKDVDHFVLNEAEITLPQFLDDLKAGRPKRIYSTNEFADIKKTPLPMFELIDLNDYIFATIQYSRGCPYYCDFCNVTSLFGRNPRTKTPQQIITELDPLIKAGHNEMIFFSDDNLIGNKKEFKYELLPLLIDWRNKNPFAPGFSTQLSINLADDKELTEMMIEAGFRNIFVGIETVEEATLLAMNKKHNSGRNLLESVHYLQSMGFIIYGSFIVGMDQDNKEVFKKLSAFIRESGIVVAMVWILNALPGTELYNRMKRENRLLKDHVIDEESTNIITIMPFHELQEEYKNLLMDIYSPQNTYERILKYYSLSRKYKAKNPIRRNVRLADFMTFFRLILHFGIISKNKKYFWMLVWFTAKMNYKYLDLSLFYATMLHYFNSKAEKFAKK